MAVKRYFVAQAAPIDGVNYRYGDTLFMEEALAQRHLGFSLEPYPGGELVTGAPGEHRESGVDVVEETRPMKEMELHEEDDRPELRLQRTPVVVVP